MANPEIVYVSTRGGSRELNFEETLLTGFADDGGLMVYFQLV